MKNKRPLAPGFINKLDEYLLLNKPDTWAARTHLVLYYGLLFIIVLTGVCFLVPDDPRKFTSAYSWTFLMCVVALLGFIIWLVYLLRFNVFKRFGIVTAGDKLKTFLLYFIAIGIMIAAVYVPSVVESIRANNAYSNEEINNDVNNMNLAICRLERDSIPHKWTYDTLLVRNKADFSKAYDEEGDAIVANHTSNFRVIDTARFNEHKNNADSLVKLNDSLYIVYESPNYNFVQPYEDFFFNESGLHHFNSEELYKLAVKDSTATDKTTILASLKVLLVKYNGNSGAVFARRYTDDDADGTTGDDNYKQRINSKYKLFDVNEGINNILLRKNRWNENGIKDGLSAFYYIVLVLALLVFIFRHTTMRVFFLSVLAGVVFLLITSLSITFLRGGTKSGYISWFVYYGLFWAIVLSGNIYNKTRTAVTGIALNFIVFSTVVIPMLLVSFYYELQREKYWHDRQLYKAIYTNEKLYYFLAQIAGVVLLLVLIETAFKKLYRKWYALPEQ